AHSRRGCPGLLWQRKEAPSRGVRIEFWRRTDRTDMIGCRWQYCSSILVTLECPCCPIRCQRALRASGGRAAMAVPIPASHLRLLTDPIVAHLATMLSDGRPQVNPVWCDYDGTYVRVNAAQDRQKTRNMRRRGFATVFLADGPYF